MTPSADSKKSPLTASSKNPPARWKKYLAFAAVVALSLVLILFSAAALYINNKLNRIDFVSDDSNWVVSETDGGTIDSTIVDYTAKILSLSKSNLPRSEMRLDDDVVNILLLGTDERASSLAEDSRADSIMLLSVHKRNNTIRLVSFERAIPVTMPNGQKDILTHAFHYGGPNYVIACVRAHFNVNVDRFVRVNFDVFETLVDAVGGVDITLTETEAKALNGEVRTNTFPLSRRVSPGLNHLNGFEALQYSRLRFTDSDWVRIERQRAVIKALQQQATTLSLAQLDNAANQVLPMVQTNMEKAEIISLLIELPQLLSYPIDDMTTPVPGSYTGTCSNVDYVKNSQILEEFLYGSN